VLFCIILIESLFHNGFLHTQQHIADFTMGMNPKCKKVETILFGKGPIHQQLCLFLFFFLIIFQNVSKTHLVTPCAFTITITKTIKGIVHFEIHF